MDEIFDVFGDDDEVVAADTVDDDTPWLTTS